MVHHGSSWFIMVHHGSSWFIMVYHGLSWFMKIAIYFLSRKVISQAKKLDVDYSFLFMQANGKQLSEISNLIETGVIRPVVDKVFSFEQLNEAMTYVSSGRAKGKVIVKVK